MKYFLVLLGILSGLYIFICIILFISQESLIFIGTQRHEVLSLSWVKSFEVETDGIRLSWYQKITGSGMTILYFWGNAEDIAGIFEHTIFSGNLIAINYRGYGKSEWKPTEENLFHDAVFLYDTLIASGVITRENTTLVGRSLGTGVATYLAVKKNIEKLVLITPYDSMKSLAQANYPYFPISLLLKHTFNTVQYISDYTGKTLILVAENDTVIPYSHTAELLKKIPSEKVVTTIWWANHNSILQYSESIQGINTFIYQ